MTPQEKAKGWLNELKEEIGEAIKPLTAAS